MAYDVHLVNPGKKRKKSMAKKKSHKRRSAPARTHATSAPRRRRRNPNPGKAIKRRRRRRNPSMRGLAGGLMGQIKGAMPRMIGQLAVAAVGTYAAKFTGQLSTGGSFSKSYGEPWAWQQYAAAAAVTMFAPKFLGKFVNPAAFTTGAIDFLLGKALFTEVVIRVPGAQKFLGEAGDYEVQYSPDGQGYVNMDGNFEAMQGLVEASALGELVPETALGELMEERALDGADYFTNRNSSNRYSY